MANNSICSIDGCDNPHKAKGFCSSHYDAQRRHGDPLYAIGTAPGEARTFYDEVVLAYEGGECLIWPFSCNSGYGQLVKDGRPQVVSRLVCEDVYGSPPTPEHEAAHSCGKGHLGCVAKRHISWKTHSDNENDKVAHDTHSRGCRNGNSSLIEENIFEIRALKGKMSQRSIATRFGISQATVSKIQRHERWSWLQASET